MSDAALTFVDAFEVSDAFHLDHLLGDRGALPLMLLNVAAVSGAGTGSTATPIPPDPGLAPAAGGTE